MRGDRSKEVPPPWQTQVVAALAEFDFAKTLSERMAALRKLQPLFAGNGARKAALRKCLALTIKAERMGEWEIVPSVERNVAAQKAPCSSLPVNLPIRFEQ